MATVIGLCFQQLQAQQNFATIEKNYNVRAKDLSHELNATRDTLILQSPKIIDYVYAINNCYQRELEFYNNSNSLKIPLNQFSTGKHTFVVGSQRMQIIFVVRIQNDKGKLALVSKDKLVLPGN